MSESWVVRRKLNTLSFIDRLNFLFSQKNKKMWWIKINSPRTDSRGRSRLGPRGLLSFLLLPLVRLFSSLFSCSFLVQMLRLWPKVVIAARAAHTCGKSRTTTSRPRHFFSLHLVHREKIQSPAGRAAGRTRVPFIGISFKLTHVRVCVFVSDQWLGD